jgi:hypothetical protein
MKKFLSCDISIASQDSGLILKIDVNALDVGNDVLTIYSQNGFKIEKNVTVINSLENITFDALNTYQTSSVGNYKLVDGSLSELSVSLSNAVNFFTNITPSNASYSLSFYSFESDNKMDSVEDGSYTSVLGKSEQYISYSQLLNYGKVVTNKVGYTILKL